MDDRERIIEALTHVKKISMAKVLPVEIEVMADAVLAALDGRLLSELPEGWKLYGISTIHDVGQTLYFATIWNPNNDGPKYKNGTDLTIADAIRDAVGEAEGDDA